MNEAPRASSLQGAASFERDTLIYCFGALAEEVLRAAFRDVTLRVAYNDWLARLTGKEVAERECFDPPSAPLGGLWIVRFFGEVLIASRWAADLRWQAAQHQHSGQTLDQIATSSERRKYKCRFSTH